MRGDALCGFVLLVTSASIALGACAGNTPPPATSTSDIVGWRRTLEEDDDRLLPAFQKLADGHGCQTTAKEGSVTAACSDGLIFMLKEGKKITIGCKGITLDECHSLFDRITAR